MSTTMQADLIDITKLVAIVGSHLIVANDAKERAIQEFAVAQVMLAAAEGRMKAATKAICADKLKEAVDSMGVTVIYDSGTVLLLASAKAAPRMLSVDRLRNALMKEDIGEAKMERIIENSKGPADKLAVSLTATLKGP